jgi:hypothetical protein
MSAFICNFEHLAVIANYAISARVWLNELQRPSERNDYAHIYKTLARQNVDGVCARYGENPSQYNAVLQPQGRSTSVPDSPVCVLKLCDGYEYQCSESPRYNASEACDIVRRVRGHAIRRLPGYDEAPWSI